MVKSYTVTYERDNEANVWVAVIDRSEGASCVTQGRSIGEARRRIREALALYLDDDAAAESAELIDDVKLPSKAKQAVARALKARYAAEHAQEVAVKVSADSARELAAAGVSTRDAAEMLGISHQAVHKYMSVRREESVSIDEVAATRMGVANSNRYEVRKTGSRTGKRRSG